MSTVIPAEIVGSVLAVAVAVGDTVAAGDTIVVLESMKMEIPVLTEVDGLVSEVGVKPGDVVQEGDILAVITPLETAPQTTLRTSEGTSEK